jgi:hypothetical protein
MVKNLISEISGRIFGFVDDAGLVDYVNKSCKQQFHGINCFPVRIVDHEGAHQDSMVLIQRCFEVAIILDSEKVSNKIKPVQLFLG